jgi:thioredoxin reductase (NADPH)
LGTFLFSSMTNSEKKLEGEYDVVIIGAGPAGLTAAIYTGRAKLSTLVVEKQFVGGEVEITDKIENYPGFPEGVTGHNLSERMRQQAERFGAKIIYGMVDNFQIQKTPKVLTIDKQEILAKAVIIATGTSPKRLGVEGEERLIGHGVSFCATCDAPFFADSDIAVVGCGNSGLQEGLYILKYVKMIHFIEILPKIYAEKILLDRVQKHANVKFHLNYEILSINGTDLVQSIRIKNRANEITEEIPVQGVFVYIGLRPNNDFLRGVVKLNTSGYIETDKKLQTSVPGVFAAGDIRDKNLYQITTAVGDGSLAAVSAERYIENLDNLE